MITIKVKQKPNADWPDGWAVFEYNENDLVYAEEHWEMLCSVPFRSTAQWFYDDVFSREVLTKTLKDGREV